jgi:hypothetical protein
MGEYGEAERDSSRNGPSRHRRFGSTWGEQNEIKDFAMRKTIKNSETELAPENASWLDVRTIARVEVTSEDWRCPIESAFDEGDERGWRAAERGKQTIRLFFDEPQRIRRIWLRFIELEAARTQQFTLQWSKDKSDALRPLFQQQWNFSPSGSRSQIEDYEVDLDSVWMLQLVIDPDIARGPAVASLASWRLA